MEFKTQLAKLINVKTLVTLTLTGVFSYLAITGRLAVEQFMTIMIMVITYFFSKKPDEPVATKTETTTTETKTSGGEG